MSTLTKCKQITTSTKSKRPHDKVVFSLTYKASGICINKYENLHEQNERCKHMIISVGAEKNHPREPAFFLHISSP